jgi:hypothetical protein
MRLGRIAPPQLRPAVIAWRRNPKRRIIYHAAPQQQPEKILGNSNEILKNISLLLILISNYL